MVKNFIFERMKFRKKYISILLLAFFSILMVEKIVPHSHVEKEGKVLADFSKKTTEHQDSEEGNEIHANFFSPIFHSFIFYVGNIDLLYSSIGIIEYKEFENTISSDYNILPKILNTLLFIVTTYSSKSPPFHS